MPRADERFRAASPVACARCGAVVLVTKFSPQHTSVQWSLSAAAQCEVLFAGPPAEACPWMRASVEDATVEITPP
jgi:hypothetical protein